MATTLSSEETDFVAIRKHLTLMENVQLLAGKALLAETFDFIQVKHT